MIGPVGASRHSKHVQEVKIVCGIEMIAVDANRGILGTG